MYTIIILLLLISSSLIYSSEEVEILRSPSRESFSINQEVPQERYSVHHIRIEDVQKDLQGKVAEGIVIETLQKEDEDKIVVSQEDLLIEKLLRSSNNQEFEKCFLDIRKRLSYSNQSYSDLMRTKRKYEDRRQVLEKALELWTSIDLVRWSTQKNKFQVFMGQLFLPVQYESLFETQFALMTREPMQYLISLSASFGNVLAQYHLREILKMYKESGVMKSTKSFISALVETLPIELNEPHYYAGLLCWTRGKMDRACEHFKLGYEKGDMWSCYRYGLKNKGGDEGGLILKKLEMINPGLAKYLLAEFEKESSMRESRFLEAGEAGIAEGYSIAGILEMDADLSRDYYLKAATAKEGILGAYDKAAEMYLKENKIEQAKALNLKKARAGDPKGFVQCGNLFLSEDKDKEAFECYEQAGFSGYQRRVHMTNDMKRKMELFHEQESELVKKIKRLKGDVEDDE